MRLIPQSNRPYGVRLVGRESVIACHLTIPQSIAWRLFTKGMDRESARAEVTISGEKAIAEPVSSLIAIVGIPVTLRVINISRYRGIA
jgi:hypothetical protein